MIATLILDIEKFNFVDKITLMDNVHGVVRIRSVHHFAEVHAICSTKHLTKTLNYNLIFLPSCRIVTSEQVEVNLLKDRFVREVYHLFDLITDQKQRKVSSKRNQPAKNEE
jgi:hypothetical protein